MGKKDRIMGASDKHAMEKAVEARNRAVTQTKKMQFRACIEAVGTCLRNFIAQNAGTSKDT